MTLAVLLSNIDSGGTLRHCSELVCDLSKKNRVIYIVLVNRITNIYVHQEGKVICRYIFFNDFDSSKLKNILKAYDVNILYIEHLLNCSPSILNLHVDLHLPLIVMMNDYYCICPFYHLVSESGIYCGEKGISVCNSCLHRRRYFSLTMNQFVDDIEIWRKKWHDYLRQAKVVIVPSSDMYKRVFRYFPDIPLHIIENPEIIQPKFLKKTRSEHSYNRNVGLIGAFSRSKGAEKVKSVLSYCVKNHCPIHFTVFGFLEDIILTKEERQYITITGPYIENKVYELINNTNIDFFWFPGTVPETYSYTLSIPIQLKIPCLSTNLGAIASRIIEHGWGDVYDWKAPTVDIINKLLKFPYMNYNSTDFTITNISFDQLEKVFKKVAVPVAFNGKLPIKISDSFNEIDGYFTDMEWHYLWRHGSNREKGFLLLHSNFKWILKKILKKISRKLYKEN